MGRGRKLARGEGFTFIKKIYYQRLISIKWSGNNKNSTRIPKVFDLSKDFELFNSELSLIIHQRISKEIIVEFFMYLLEPHQYIFISYRTA